jgi:hypothetical protein
MAQDKSSEQSSGAREKNLSTTTKSSSVFGLYEQLGEMLHALRRGDIDCKTVNAACNIVGKQVDIVRLVFEHATLVDRGVIKESLPMMESEPIKLVENGQCAPDQGASTEEQQPSKAFRAKDWKPTPEACRFTKDDFR